MSQPDLSPLPLHGELSMQQESAEGQAVVWLRWYEENICNPDVDFFDSLATLIREAEQRGKLQGIEEAAKMLREFANQIGELKNTQSTEEKSNV